MTIAIQPFSVLQSDQVASLILGIQQNEFGVPVTLQDQPDLLNIPDFYQAGGGGFWVALDNDRVVGTIGLRGYAPHGMALRKMFVAREHRGKAGVGQRLLEVALAHARQRGAYEVCLGTVDQLRAAQRFYAKNGFQRIAPEALPAHFPRMPVDSLFYRLELVHSDG